MSGTPAPGRSRRRGRTVQQRLTIAFLALLTALVGTIGVFESLQLKGVLTDAAAARVRAQAKPVIDGLVTTRPQSLTDLAQRLADDLTSADTGALVIGQDGQVLASPRSSTVGADAPAPPPADALARALAGAREVDVVRNGPQGRELVALVPLPGRSPPRAVVVLATPLADEEGVLVRQALLTAAGLAAVLALAALLGPLLIHRALRPLRSIADTTRQIADGDLSRRVAWMGPDDEIGQLAVSVDVMTASLQRAFQDLALSQEQMTGFVADASHELRTPLTALGGYADVLLRRVPDEDGPDSDAQLLVALRREVDRMQRLVADLLDLAKLDSGVELRLARVDVTALARSVLAQLQPVSGGRRLVVEGGAAWAVVDEDRLRQVLLNLTSNALRHTSGDGTVEVQVERAAGGLRLTVLDDGEGMTPATLDRAFERFARGETVPPGKGAGLGLSIVASIVRAHAGQVGIVSAPREGTVVEVRLPQEGLRST